MIVVLEGPDKTGKTTAAAEIKERLGDECVIEEFPSKEIRKQLKKPDSFENLIYNHTLFEVDFHSRNQELFENSIHKVLICVRHYYSNIVYLRHNIEYYRSHDPEKFRILNKFYNYIYTLERRLPVDVLVLLQTENFERGDSDDVYNDQQLDEITKLYPHILNKLHQYKQKKYHTVEALKEDTVDKIMELIKSTRS